MSEQQSSFTLKKSLLFTAIIFVVIFAILEVASRYIIANYAETGSFSERVLQNQYHPYLGWVHSPNAQLKISKGIMTEETWVETDANGFSITPLRPENPVFRIAVTGGSTMFGVGSSSNETTVPSYLEQILTTRLGVPVEVTNLGVRGYHSFQELLILRRFLTENDVDFVLAISGRNDASGTFFEPRAESAMLPNHVHANAVPLVRAAETQKPIVQNIDGYLRASSAFFDLVARAIRRLMPEAAEDHSTNVTPADQRAAAMKAIPLRSGASGDHFSMMNDLALRHGAQFTMFLQPTLFTWSGYPDNTPKELFVGKEEQGVFEQQFYTSLLKELIGTPHIDATRALDSLADAPYIDHTHYNDVGAEKLATFVADYLQVMIRDFYPEKFAK